MPTVLEALQAAKNALNYHASGDPEVQETVGLIDQVMNPEADQVENLARAIFEGGNEYFGMPDLIGWNDKIGDPEEDKARDEFRKLARLVLTYWCPGSNRTIIEMCAKIAEEWSVSRLSANDLTDDQLNELLNGIGPNIAYAIRKELIRG